MKHTCRRHTKQGINHTVSMTETSCITLTPLISMLIMYHVHSDATPTTCSSTWSAAGWWYFRIFLEKPPANQIFVRGRLHEKDPVTELLSEHCFAGKCSTSHVKPAVNRQPGYRRGTRRAFSKRTAGKSASISNHQKIATTTA